MTQPNKNDAIVKSPCMDEKEKLVREYLLRFSVHWPRDLTPMLISSWCDAVAHVTDLNALQAAFERTLKSRIDRTAFPAPGDVLQHIEQATEKARDIDGERVWQKVEKYIADYSLGADVGFSRRAPGLPPDIEHAVRAAGGLRKIESCSESDLVWCKKRFLEALQTYRSAPDLHPLSTGEARAIFAECAKRMAETPRRPALPAPPVPSAITAEEIEQRKRIAAEERERVLRAVAPLPEPKMSQGEIRRTAEAQQAALRKHAKLLGIEGLLESGAAKP